MTAPTPSPEEFACSVWERMEAGNSNAAGDLVRARDASLTAPLREEVERLTRERDEALRGFGIGPNEPVGLKRYAEVFTREIRECPPRTQDTEGAVCACVSVITAHVRRMLQERLDAKDEALSLREEREDYRKAIAELKSRAERAEAENARLRAALDEAKNWLMSIAIVDQDDRPLNERLAREFDWRRRSMTQESMARRGHEIAAKALAPEGGK